MEASAVTRFAILYLCAGALAWAGLLFPPVPRKVSIQKASSRSTETNRGADTRRSIVNSLGMRLMLIPPGEFQMGSPDSDGEASSSEKPQHRVSIRRRFYMGAHEVTVDNFKTFVQAAGYKTEAEQEGGGWGWDRSSGKFVQNPRFSWNNLVIEKADFVQDGNHPVVNVSWNDALAFCRWLSRKEERAYRLPTEAEWEYTCRAGTSSRYYVGDTLSPEQANFGKSRGSPVPVGSYQPNAFGLYDMHGNVWEFCSDWHDDSYYQHSDQVDPTGPSEPGSANYHARRGGDWLHGVKDSRSAARYIYNYRPQARYNVIIGFRVVREP